MTTGKDILVSVIIPCYNAGKFIGDTISSVLAQSHTDLELICINDGSADNTEKEIGQFSDERIRYFSKQNTGVSDTRNAGIGLSSGKYIVFLDADDLLAPDFISKRVALLEQRQDYGFCASRIIKIDESGKIIDNNSRGPYDSALLEEILLYKSNISTCPSIFMIRKDVLIKNNIIFNKELSSSADRFFLIELSKCTAGGFVDEGGELYYRVHEESMSHKLTARLIDDNRKYYRELKRNDYIPGEYYREFSFKINYIFAGSSYKLKKFGSCMIYALKAFYYSPVGFLKQLNS
jgi:teichuronic acid biosynthesis glycosyltransferase TuaG